MLVGQPKVQYSAVSSLESGRQKYCAGNNPQRRDNQAGAAAAGRIPVHGLAPERFRSAPAERRSQGMAGHCAKIETLFQKHIDLIRAR
jgi:hypothetical protein